MHYSSSQTATRATAVLVAHEARWRKFGVRRASDQAYLPAMSTGWSALDRLLPGGGYPLAAVTELLCADTCLGELTLLLEGLRRRMISQPARQLAFICPPHSLHAPALQAAGLDMARLPIVTCRDDDERVWCMEQMARSGAFAAFVLWSDTLDTTALRRLQLAAEAAVCPVFVYRGLAQVRQRSPAALRLMITSRSGVQGLEILKCRGPAGARLNGLRVGRDRPWQPVPERHADITLAACNDPENNPENSCSHVARSAFPPLGAR